MIPTPINGIAYADIEGCAGQGEEVGGDQCQKTGGDYQALCSGE
jgi:hypothetical protein